MLRLFIGDGHISSELSHVIGQVADWIRYLEDNLPTVKRELGLNGISSNPKSPNSNRPVFGPDDRQSTEALDDGQYAAQSKSYDLR